MNAPAAHRTQVVRDLGETKVNLILCVVFLGLAVIGFLVFEHWLVLTLAGLVGLIGISAGLIALGASCQAPCPSCGETIRQLASKKNAPAVCKKCLKFYEGNHGQLWAVDPNHVESKPIFEVKLPERFMFPPLCCVCGQPPTRFDELSDEYLHGASLVTIAAGRIVKQKLTVTGVPYCDAHRDGVAIEGGKTIKFRSYPFLRAFCLLNRIAPGEPESTILAPDVAGMIELLGDEAADFRKQGATVLMYQGVEAVAAVARLEELLSDEDAEVQAAARRALQVIAPERLTESTKPD